MQCFVIGPIGEDGSETRKNADHLFEYVIRPVLAGLNFDVIRADRLKTVAAISDEIVNFIQTSELCIIDLSEANPNVFYEAGRRHETGRPYVHLLRAGQKAPFDVQGTRYINYKDLSVTPNVFDAQQQLREFVDIIMKTGFGASRSSNPFNNIEESLRRLENQVTDLSLRIAAPTATGPYANPTTPAIKESSFGLFVDPRDRVVESLKRNDFRQAEAALVDLDDISVDKEEVLLSAGILARAGRRHAADIILKYTRSDIVFHKLSGDIVSKIMSGLSEYYRVTGQAATGKSQIVEIVDRILNSASFQGYTDSEKAEIVNSAQRICYVCDDNETALRYAEMAQKFEPNTPVWVYNAAMICYDAKDYLRAANLYTKYLSMMTDQGRQARPENLRFGARVFAKVGQMSQMQDVLSRLAAADPYMAADVQKELSEDGH